MTGTAESLPRDNMYNWSVSSLWKDRERGGRQIDQNCLHVISLPLCIFSVVQHGNCSSPSSSFTTFIVYRSSSSGPTQSTRSCPSLLYSPVCSESFPLSLAFLPCTNSLVYVYILYLQAGQKGWIEHLLAIAVRIYIYFYIREDFG